MEDTASTVLQPDEEMQEPAEEDMCRYCFCGSEEEDRLIAPCACQGSQKWCHLECLRRWQRSVADPSCSSEALDGCLLGVCM